EAVLRQWMNTFPNDSRPGELLAPCLLELGRFPEVVTMARRNRERFGPSLFGASRVMAALAMTHRLAELGPSVEILDKLPAPSWSLRCRGISRAIQEDYDGANSFFRELLSKTSGEEASRATSLLAAVAADRSDLDQAASLLEAGVSHDRQAGEE